MAKKATNKFLNREGFLAIDDREVREVEIPGGVVQIRELDGETVGNFVIAQEQGDEIAKKGMYILISESVIDADTGEKMFSREDIAALGKKSFRTLQKLQNAVMELNGLSGGGAEIAKNA